MTIVRYFYLDYENPAESQLKDFIDSEHSSLISLMNFSYSNWLAFIK